MMKTGFFWVPAVTTLFFLSSCAPKIKIGIVHPLPALPDTARLVLLSFEDSLTGQPAVYIGNIRFGDAGLSTNCDYDEEVGMLTNAARKNGANLVKITFHKAPDRLSSCDRIQANLYFDEGCRDFERQFPWSSKRRLDWKDFKSAGGDMKDTGSAAAYTHCGIVYRYHVLTNFSKPYFSVKAYMNCRSSWVRADQQYRPDLLAHEQAHFDLCEVYARTLRKKLREERPGPREFPRASERIYRDVLRQLTARQQAYDIETHHGLNRTVQQDWQERITGELIKLHDFAD